MGSLTPTLTAILFAAVTAVVLLVLSFLAQRVIAGTSVPRHVVDQGNVAQALLTAGHLFGVFMITAAVVTGCPRGQDLVEDAGWTALFGVCGVLLLAVAGRLGTQVIVGSKLVQEIERGNAAAGIAAAGHYAATGVIIASCLYGHDLATLGISLLFFAIAQLTLHLFVLLFRAVTRYRDSEEIHDENVAAALSYAGVTVALGMIIAHAADGTFVSWASSLRAYALALLASVALYPVRQIIVGVVLVGGGLSLRGGRLDEGIARGRNVGLGILEASAYLATAAFVTRLVA